MKLISILSILFAALLMGCEKEQPTEPPKWEVEYASVNIGCDKPIITWQSITNRLFRKVQQNGIATVFKPVCRKS